MGEIRYYFQVMIPRVLTSSVTSVLSPLRFYNLAEEKRDLLGQSSRNVSKNRKEGAMLRLRSTSGRSQVKNPSERLNPIFQLGGPTYCEETPICGNGAKS